MDIKVGQVLEFIVPAQIEGRAIARGTRVRVGHIMAEVQEPRLTLVLLDESPPQTFVANRHEVTLNCRVVSPA